MDLKIAFLLIFSAAMFVAFFSLKLLPEYQRYAIFIGGRYIGLKGPGMFMKWPSLEKTWVLVSVGDIGKIVRPGVGKLGEHEYPISMEDEISVGANIKIGGFGVDRIVVILDSSHDV